VKEEEGLPVFDRLILPNCMAGLQSIAWNSYTSEPPPLEAGQD